MTDPVGKKNEKINCTLREYICKYCKWQWLVCTPYIELLKLDRLKKNPITILTKDMKRNFAKGDIRIKNNQWKDVQHH